MPLPTIPHHALSYILLFIFLFHHFLLATLLLVHIHPYHPTAPLHLSLSSSYKVHSNNTCISVSTSPQPHLQSSYFHVILSLPITGKHPPLTISRTLAPTLPSAKLSFIGLSFIRTYSFSRSVSLIPYFHALLPLSCILSQIYFFHHSRSTFIPRFTIPFTLTSLRQIRFTNSNIPDLLYICLHLDHHLDLHHISIRHALPISDTKFSSNTTLNIAFASLSSKVRHPVSPVKLKRTMSPSLEWN